MTRHETTLASLSRSARWTTAMGFRLLFVWPFLGLVSLALAAAGVGADIAGAIEGKP